jgi:hypothetical protein
MDETLLNNVAFALFYCLGDYLLMVFGWISAVAVVLGITHTLTK